MALHEQCVGATDEWYTPRYIFDALGCHFDMDVAPVGGSGGLTNRWHGFVWMNPPFGGRNGIAPWLERFVEHGNGIALAPDRTSAPWWQQYARQMDLLLFVSPKIKFIGADGKPGKSPAQGTTLMALGMYGRAALMRAQPKLGLVVKPC
jgi:hypothetical protein